MKNLTLPKFYFGPMSKCVVESIIEFSDEYYIPFGIIPSRRQVEFNGGYSNNWTTASLREFVIQKSSKKLILIERDHGGPLQGSEVDDGLESYRVDSSYLDMIHIDPWKAAKSLDQGIEMTLEHIKFCHDLNPSIFFEVGTEEAIRPFSAEDIEKLLSSLKQELTQDQFGQIIYCVVQSGVGLDLGNGNNTGLYNPEKLMRMNEIVHSYSLLSKEHNGDYLDILYVADRFNRGLDAINIAPEMSQYETKTYLDILSKCSPSIMEALYQLCLNSKKWCKWVGKDFSPEENKLILIKICAHYVYSTPKFNEIKTLIAKDLALTADEIDGLVKSRIKSRLKDFYELNLNLEEKLGARI